jgi:hypothetical protein
MVIITLEKVIGVPSQVPDSVLGRVAVREQVISPSEVVKETERGPVAVPLIGVTS